MRITRTMRAAPAIAVAALLAVPLGAGQAAAQAVQAGVAGAVVSPVQVSGPPRPETVEAVSGMDVFLDDRIQTGAGARLQVLLLDETVFTVGPESDLVIDRFVYDPDTGAGEMAGSMTTGFLRYVSGAVGENNPENVTIDTPAATIGIRGTALLIAEIPDEPGSYWCGVLGPGRDNNSLSRPGGCFVSNEFGSTEVLREGFGARFTAGQAPGAPERLPDELLARVQDDLRPAGVAALGDGAIPAAAAEAASGDPEQISLQNVAQQREITTETVQLLSADYASLTESGTTDELDQRPATELIDDLTPGMEGDFTIDVPFVAQLNWSNVPDLDLHATGPNPGGAPGRYHVFFANPIGPEGVAELEVGSGFDRSEVLAINSLGSGGVTRISVFNFSDQTPGSTSLAGQSEALVSLLRNGRIDRGPGGSTVIDGDLVDFIRPPASGAGNTFVAYEIQPDGTVTAVGELTDFPNSLFVE